MPEAAEVKRCVLDLHAHVRGHMLNEAIVESGRYARTPIKAFEHLDGKTIQDIRSFGKLVVWTFHKEDGIAPPIYGLNTFGLTGYWYPRSHGDEIKHVRLTFRTSGGTISFSDPRNFGTFKIVGKKELQRKLMELGPPVMDHDVYPQEEIEARLARFGKRKSIAEALLDQRIFCGVGNYVRADAMFLAGVDPRVPATSLSSEELGMLWAKCQSVCIHAYHDVSIMHDALDNSYVSPCYGRKKTAVGIPIETYIDRGGRTVWWCPQMQGAK